MSIPLSPFEALQAAVAAAGTQAALATICGVSQPAVWKWLQSSKRIPAEYVLRVEAATGVSRHYLRPDIYPAEMPEAPSRWSGVDHRAGVRGAGVDGRARTVSCNKLIEMKGATL